MPHETGILANREKGACKVGERHWQTGEKVPTNLIRADAHSYKGARPYNCERAGLYVRADAGIRVLFLWMKLKFYSFSLTRHSPIH